MCGPRSALLDLGSNEFSLSFLFVPTSKFSLLFLVSFVPSFVYFFFVFFVFLAMAYDIRRPFPARPPVFF